jgi:cell division protein FtsA
MNGTVEYVMAFDLGSAHITAALGLKQADGKLRILALERRPVCTEIRHGVVHNIEAVSAILRELRDTLSLTLTPALEVNHVFTGINGYTIRTKDVRIDAPFDGTEIFNEQLLDELGNQIPESLPEGFVPINIYPQEFLVDGRVDRNPVGSMPKHVEAHYKVVGGSADVLRKAEAAFSNIHLTSCANLGPVAAAEAVLTEEEKNRGVVCVDLGAETTSVSVWKGDLLRSVTILPFGGNSVTADLQQLNLDEEEAERLKIGQGTALHYSELEEPEGSPFSREYQEINDIIVARLEEIVENIWAQINRSGIEPAKLLSGVVLTGGGSRMRDLDKLVARKTAMSVRIGQPTVHLEPGGIGLFGYPENAQCIGLLLQGDGGCFQKEPEPVSVVKEEEKAPSPIDLTLEGFPPEQPKPAAVKPVKPVKVKPPRVKKPNRLKGFINDLTDFLNNDNDD